MRNGDLYRHYKNKEYRFEYIALPLREVAVLDAVVKWGQALNANTPDGEEIEVLDLYATDQGIVLIHSPYPHVIYQSEEDYGTDKVWARRVDDFFSYVPTIPAVEGVEIPLLVGQRRFKLKERD